MMIDPPEPDMLEGMVLDTVLDGRDGDATALFDTDRRYRYALTRQWDRDKPWAAFLMLNPSTANAFVLDRTLNRCKGFAQREDRGGMLILNLFALRSTDPRALYDDPWAAIGPRNDQVIDTCLQDLVADTARYGLEPLVVFGWGTHGALEVPRTALVAGPTAPRGAMVRHRLVQEQGLRPYALKVTASGHPGHPLYVNRDAPLRPYGWSW